MEAPDKIYLHKIRDEESSGFHKMWFEQRARCVPSEEYIRKDLLLEWLSERKKYYQGLIPAEGAVAFICALDEVKHKIESI